MCGLPDQPRQPRHPMPAHDDEHLFASVLQAILLAPEPELGLALCALGEIEARYEEGIGTGSVVPKEGLR